MDKNNLSLKELNIGESGKVVEILCDGLIKRRLLDIGVVPNTIITAVRHSPRKDPTCFLIKGALIALRNEEKSNIIIEKIK